MTPSQISALASGIADGFGLNQCRQCSTALREAFLAARLHGSVLKLSTVGGRGYIVMKNPTFKLPFALPQGVASIASNGQHFGVLVGNTVFDNVFRTGIGLADWQFQFDCDVHKFSMMRIEPF